MLATAAMAAAAWLCGLLGGAPVLYGIVFLLTAGAAAVWVRPVDLVCAPIAAPIAFAAGLAATEGLMGMATELALRAPWLFAGTLIAAVITLLRKAVLLLRQILQRRRRARQRRRGLRGSA